MNRAQFVLLFFKLTCCDQCGDGCDGGDPASAWEWCKEFG